MASNDRSVVSALIILLPGLVFGILARPTEMGLAIIGGAIAAAFLNMDKIQRFRGAGFEAEMKKAVEEAYATIENLRELARPLVVSTLGVLTFSGRWGGMDPDQKHKLAQDLERITESLSLNYGEVESAKHQFYRYHTWDRYTEFINAVSKEENIDSTAKRRLAELRDYKSPGFPSKEVIEKTLGSSVDNLGAETRGVLKDYLYYVENHRLRRKETLPPP